MIPSVPYKNKLHDVYTIKDVLLALKSLVEIRSYWYNMSKSSLYKPSTKQLRALDKVKRMCTYYQNSPDDVIMRNIISNEANILLLLPSERGKHKSLRNKILTLLNGLKNKS